MTRALVIMFTESWKEGAVLYANGRWTDVIMKQLENSKPKTNADVYKFFYDAGYREPSGNCNPEVLDYVVISLEYSQGVLIFHDDEAQ